VPARAPGLPPGTVEVAPGAPAPKIHVFGYGPTEVEELAVTDLSQVAALRGRWPVLWVNVNGLGDGSVITRLGELFDLHPLALEDVAHTTQRPKVENYANCLYIVLRLLRWTETATELESEQLSMFLGRDFVLTFQEREGDPFDPVRERIRKARPLLREAGADYLAYALLDSVIDHLFPLMQAYGDVLEDLEDLIMEKPTRATLGRVRHARRALVGVRRAVWPLRDAVNSLQEEHLPFIQPETRLYLRDTHDHVLRVIDLAESYRDEVTGLMEGYLSSVSLRMNEVMGMLTLVGTIFLPLSFLTGLYGMNFDPSSPWNQPELRWHYGYPALLGFMGLLSVAMVTYFWRRGWFAVVGATRRPEDDVEAP